MLRTITAPLGAVLVNITHKKLLTRSDGTNV